MDSIHEYGRLCGYLLAMEEINEDERYKMYYHFQEIPWLGDIDASLQSYYQHFLDNYRVIGYSADVLYEASNDWFFEKNKREHSSSSMDNRAKKFIDLLNDFFDSNPIEVYECELPFNLFGAYSEHYLIVQEDRGFALQFCMA